METVLNSPELMVTDSRLARCKHPRLRQALMFHPPHSQPRPGVAVPRTEAAEVSAARKADGGKVMKSVTSFVAVTVVRVMSFMFEGFQFVTAPL